MLCRLVVALCLVVTVTSPALAQRKPGRLTIYISTHRDPSGIVSNEEQGRLDSVRDLQGSVLLRRFKNVDAPDMADVHLTVLGRTMTTVDAGARTFMFPNGFGGFHGFAVPRTGRRMALLATAVVRGRTTEAVGTANGRWGAAADGLLQDLRRWIDRNWAVLSR